MRKKQSKTPIAMVLLGLVLLQGCAGLDQIAMKHPGVMLGVTVISGVAGAWAGYRSGQAAKEQTLMARGSREYLCSQHVIQTNGFNSSNCDSLDKNRVCLNIFDSYRRAPGTCLATLRRSGRLA